MIKISACTITKNEAENIERWISCVKQIASEIVIVDTGSTDNTVELAKKNGARVERFTWQDDFAIAKNFALDCIHGEWVLFPDADEYFSARSVPLIADLIEKHHRNLKTAGIVCPRLNIDAGAGNILQSSDSQVRIFRHRKDIRYKNRVHEYLVSTKGKPINYKFEPGIEIYHTGYSKDLVKGKLERNLAILLQSGTADQEENYVYLMDCYYGMADYEKAEEYAKKIIEADACSIGMETHPYEVLFHIMKRKQEKPEEIERLLKKADKRFPESPKICILEGYESYSAGDYERAQMYFNKAKMLIETEQQVLIAGEALPASCLDILPTVYRFLGAIKCLQGAKDEGVDYFLAGLKIYPYNRDLLELLLNSINGQTVQVIVGLLNSLFDKRRDAAFLKDVLQKCELYEAAGYYEQFGA